MRTPAERYLDLLSLIKYRLDETKVLKELSAQEFLKGEIAALHGRKIVEAIAHGCVVAADNAGLVVHKKLRGHWKASETLLRLSRAGYEVYPSPSLIRHPRPEEGNVNAVIEGVPERRLSPQELLSCYQRMDKWLHELNPYAASDLKAFASEHARQLWTDLARIEGMLDGFTITIQGVGFWCVLHDPRNGEPQVTPISKQENT